MADGGVHVPTRGRRSTGSPSLGSAAEQSQARFNARLLSHPLPNSAPAFMQLPAMRL